MVLLSAPPAHRLRHATSLAVGIGGADVLVGLDINYRAALWEPPIAGKVLTDLVRRCDIVFAGDDEAGMLRLTGSPEELATALVGLGPSQAVIKLGAQGAVASIDGKPYRAEAVPVNAVGPVGASDAFVAGYVAELLAGQPPATRLYYQLSVARAV